MVLRGSKEERGTGRTGKGIRCHLSWALSSEDSNSVEEKNVQLGTEYGEVKTHLTDVFEN